MKVELKYADGKVEIVEVDAPNQRDAVVLATRDAEEHRGKSVASARCIIHPAGK